MAMPGRAERRYLQNVMRGDTQMAIDETVRSDVDNTTSSPSSPSFETTREHPKYIQTWPLTTDDLDGSADATTGDNSAKDTEDDAVRAPALVIPEAVKQWPAWMQRQWTETRRRHQWEITHPPTLASRIFTPASMLILSGLLIVALVGFGIG